MKFAKFATWVGAEAVLIPQEECLRQNVDVVLVVLRKEVDRGLWFPGRIADMKDIMTGVKVGTATGVKFLTLGHQAVGLVVLQVPDGVPFAHHHPLPPHGATTVVSVTGV